MCIFFTKTIAMKISRGKVRLQAGETRVGSFVLKDKDGMIQVRDISGSVFFSVSKSLPKGMLLEYMAKESQEGLKGIIAVTWNFLSVVPDMAFLSGVNRLCKECAERYPEMYGVMKDTDQDKELSEAMLDEAARGEFAKAAEKTEGVL